MLKDERKRDKEKDRERRDKDRRERGEKEKEPKGENGSEVSYRAGNLHSYVCLIKLNINCYYFTKELIVVTIF